MFVPLYDDNPLRHITAPWVTRGLILANVLIYIVFQEPRLVGPAEAEAVLASFGMIPAVVSGSAYLPPELQRLPEETTLLTYMFLHAGWLHLGTNMLFLWVFGDNVEDALGPCPLPGVLPHLRRRGAGWSTSPRRRTPRCRWSAPPGRSPAASPPT